MNRPFTIPKSLHTVRVMVIMARYIDDEHSVGAEESVDRALVLLGYENTPDMYRLRDAAVKQLNARP